MASRLWRFLTTDVSELFSIDTVKTTADKAGAVFGLAEVLQKEGPNVEELARVSAPQSVVKYTDIKEGL